METRRFIEPKDVNCAFGIGVDIEGISRFRDLDRTKNKHFLSRVFTDKEVEYCFSKKDPAPHLAARFTGKEAVIKALSSLGESCISCRDIEITNNDKGLPEAILNNVNLNKLKIKLSLSHSQDAAIAYAIAVRKDRQEPVRGILNQNKMDKVKNIFSKVMGIPESDVNDAITYNSFEPWDSLKHLELVSELESEYKINIEMDDIIAMENYKKVREIVQRYIDKKT
ncbi:MAG: 4'-phosphopantetheinyl transferase superfamily protein [Candidatus Altiarchaeia archaeon]